MRVRKLLFAAILAGVGLALAAPEPASAQPGVSIAVFHEQLAPYGRWVVAGSYGHVWVPQVSAGWAPYVDGQWVYTSYGWTWQSNDPWGGVPCHYGSWAWADPYGWVWTPGTVWAPAWVTWAYSDDYIGWAPIPPSFGFGVTGYVGAPVVVATTRYVFVPTRQFVGVPVASVRVPVARNEVIFTKAVKNTDYRVSGGIVRTAGPPPERIEKVTQHKVAEVSIDRVKTRPTTLAEGGAAKASRIAPAAPAAEREKIAAKPAAETREPAGKQAKANPRQPVQEQAKAPEPRSSHPVQSAQQAPATPHNHNHKAPQHEPATSAEKPTGSTAEKAHLAPPPKTKATSEGQAKARPQEERPPTHSNEPTEETHVASHEAKAPPAHGHPQASAPKAKPKPPEKKPEPPKEEKPQ